MSETAQQEARRRSYDAPECVSDSFIGGYQSGFEDGAEWQASQRTEVTDAMVSTAVRAWKVGVQHCETVLPRTRRMIEAALNGDDDE